MSWISAAIAIIKAIPTVERWFSQLATAYKSEEIEKMKRENADAIRKALLENDQRWIERVIKSQAAGKPSGVPSTEIRDTLPGVKI